MDNEDLKNKIIKKVSKMTDNNNLTFLYELVIRL